MCEGTHLIEKSAWKALKLLIQGSGPEFRARVTAAAEAAHQFDDVPFHTRWLSDTTIEAWRNCSPAKDIISMTEDELQEVARDLAGFIIGAACDVAVRSAFSK